MCTPVRQDRYGAWAVANPDTHPFVESIELAFDDSIGFMTLMVNVASSPNPLVFPAVPRGESEIVTAGLVLNQI